jgi:pyridoxal phosphate enzyme (YggS family)
MRNDRVGIMELKTRFEEIRGRVARAAERAGRPASAITIIAVTKTFPATVVRSAFEIGIPEIGENKAQELIEKQSELAELPIRWHFIGHLQTNKVRKVLPITSMIHSVDSPHLAKRIEEVAAETDREIDVLLQVNSSGETTKFGFEPEELDTILAAVLPYSHLRIRGLMTLGPWTEDSTEIRRAFRLMRDLSIRLQQQLPDADLLSMGMSGDFEIAVEEGATHLRLGTVLFGPRG